MQVFKLYFKILRKYKGQMIMYLCIFAALLSTFVLNNKAGNTEYLEDQCKFAVVDADQTEESKALISYLSEKHEKVTITDEELETIQDDLYNRNINCFLKIPKGFGKEMQQGDVEGALVVYAIPGTQKANIFEGDVDSYVNYLATYYAAGETRAIEKTKHSLEKQADVTLFDGKTDTGNSKLSVFFRYLGWVIMSMIIVGITPILCTVFSQKELKRRTACSPYPNSKMNLELLAAIAATGIGICVIIFVLASILVGDEFFTEKGEWNMVNAFVYLLIAMSIAYMISKFTSNEQVISMLANVISLGMAFLCGIFVPAEFLGTSVIRMSKVLPAYWFTKGVEVIDHLETNSVMEIISHVGIQLLFASAFWCVAMVVSKNKKA